VTSPASAASKPSRRASTPPLRRAAKIVLIIGTASSFGLALGPNWATKIGIAVAVAAAIVGCMLAWRELWHVHRAHAQQMLEISKKHGKALSEERRHNAGVLELMSKRVKEYVIVVEGQKVTIAQLRGQVSALRGDNAYLKTEITHRETVIVSLRETVRAREAELVALLTDDSDADVHTLPRRVLAETTADPEEVAAAGDLWTDGSHPTVVDMAPIDDLVLPNFEGDRKLA
jgi:hypothetical protein